MISVSSETMRKLEEHAFQHGHSPWALMQEAGLGISKHILRYFPHSKHAIAFLGKGNNAGDALVALKHLKEAGWEVELRSAFPIGEWGELSKKAYTELGKPPLKTSVKPTAQTVLIDGLLGTGTQGSLRAPLDAIAEEINSLRAQSGATTVSLDIPSGIENEAIHVTADHTLNIGLPKSSTLGSEVVNSVGALGLIPLSPINTHQEAYQQILAESNNPGFSMVCPESLQRKRRSFDQHKGQSGRVGIWAGSEGMLGAAALAATASLKAGAGLITVFIPPTLYPVLATMVPAEVMVKPAIDPRVMLDMDFDALIIGPGIGSPVPSLAERLLHVIEHSTVPTVIDADALNLIAAEEKLSVLNQHSIITPHPGEFDRLFPKTQGSREERSQRVQHNTPATLVYKGSRSIVCSPDSPLWVNSSGTPAMATAGQGDVLSGLIGGFCAQGYSKLEAAKLGVWIAGDAAQRALSTESTETLSASSVIASLADALNALPAT